MTKNIKWNSEKLHEYALKFNTPSAFNKAYPGGAKAARRLRITGSIYAHMAGQNTWSVDKIWLVAEKYHSIGAFYRGNINAYQAARDHNVITDIRNYYIDM